MAAGRRRLLRGLHKVQFRGHLAIPTVIKIAFPPSFAVNSISLPSRRAAEIGTSAHVGTKKPVREPLSIPGPARKDEIAGQTPYCTDFLPLVHVGIASITARPRRCLAMNRGDASGVPSQPCRFFGATTIDPETGRRTRTSRAAGSGSNVRRFPAHRQPDLDGPTTTPTSVPPLGSSRIGTSSVRLSMDQPPSAEAGASGLDAPVGGRRRRHHPHMPISRIANLTPGQLERQTMRRRRR